MQRHLADSVCAGVERAREGVVAPLARAWPWASRLPGKEGWWPGRGVAAGTPCQGVRERELPFLPASLIKELLFLAV